MANSLVAAAFKAGADLISPFLPRKPASPEYKALNLLAEFEGVQYCGGDGGKALFVHHSEQFSGRFPYSDLPPLLTSFQEARDLFAGQQKLGTTEVNVPKDIVFHPLSARFSEIRDAPPVDRKYSTCTLGMTDGSSKKGYNTTKDKLEIGVVVGSFNELITQFEAAIRASTAQPLQSPSGAAPA